MPEGMEDDIADNLANYVRVASPGGASRAASPARTDADAPRDAGRPQASTQAGAGGAAAGGKSPAPLSPATLSGGGSGFLSQGAPAAAAGAGCVPQAADGASAASSPARLPFSWDALAGGARVAPGGAVVPPEVQPNPAAASRSDARGPAPSSSASARAHTVPSRPHRVRPVAPPAFAGSVGARRRPRSVRARAGCVDGGAGRGGCGRADPGNLAFSVERVYVKKAALPPTRGIALAMGLPLTGIDPRDMNAWSDLPLRSHVGRQIILSNPRLRGDKGAAAGSRATPLLLERLTREDAAGYRWSPLLGRRYKSTR